MPDERIVWRTAVLDTGKTKLEDEMNRITFACAVWLITCPHYLSLGQDFVPLQDKRGRSHLVAIDPAPGGARTVFHPSVHLRDYEIDPRHLNLQEIDRLTHALVNDLGPIFELGPGDVQLHRADTDGGLWFVSCRQVHDGVRVAGTEFGYTINQTGEVIALGSRAYPGLKVSTNPTLSAVAAIDIAETVFNEEHAEIRGDAELLIYPEKKTGQFHLAWSVRLFSMNTFRDITYFIESHSGNIVHSFSNMIDAYLPVRTDTTTRQMKQDSAPQSDVSVITGYTSGKYFVVDHLGSVDSTTIATRNITMRTLLGRRIPGSFHTDANGKLRAYVPSSGIYEVTIPLESKWVKLLEDLGQPTEDDFDDITENAKPVQRTFYTSTGTSFHLSWSVSNSTYEADAANVHYHVHRAHDIFSSAPFNFSGMDYQMKAYVTDKGLLNGHANGTDMFFGKWRDHDYAQSADVVYHEYMHNVHWQVFGGHWFGEVDDPQDRALAEGIADYFAGSIMNNPIIGANVGINRNLDNDTYEWTRSKSAHWNGQVVGGAIWDFRQVVGKTTADHLAFTALRISPRAYNFNKFGFNMMLADYEHYGATNVSSIKKAFDGHGITIAVPKVEVSISGPDSVEAGKRGVWAAIIAKGNRPPLKYKWEYLLICDKSEVHAQESQCGTWTYASSKDVYSRIASSKYDLTLRVRVSDKYGVTGTAEKTIKTYVRDRSNSGRVTDVEVHGVLPATFALQANYPNPFNPVTVIRFELPRRSKVKLAVYDLGGRVVAELRNGSFAAGQHTVSWDASHLPSGVYIYRLVSGTVSESRFMTLLK